MKKRLFIQVLLVILLSSLLCTPDSVAGHPTCHLLLCCRDTNNGTTFLVDGQWRSRHTYMDINQVRDIIQKVKDAGIKTVILDMTNEVMWTKYYEQEYKIEIENIIQVCKEKNMQYTMHIGSGLKDLVFWNQIAKRIWDTWAHTPTYRKYGFGDDRPILVVFRTSQSFWDEYNSLAPKDKEYLSKFHLGTVIVNDPVTPQDSDGWGYRHTFQNPDGTVRFAAPTKGLAPTQWQRISKAEWIERINWVKAAEHYSIYGSYDDVCDAISFGIANTKNTTTGYNVYPDHDAYIYYDALKNALTANTSIKNPYDILNLPGTIEAGNFDNSRQGIAYNDAATFGNGLALTDGGLQNNISYSRNERLAGARASGCFSYSTSSNHTRSD